MGMPTEGEETLGLDAVHRDLERDAAVLCLHFGDFRVDGSTDDRAAHGSARAKRSVEFDAEPGFELSDVSQGAPDAGAGGAEEDLLFDAVGGFRSHMQPLGCMLAEAERKCNCLVACQ